MKPDNDADHITESESGMTALEIEDLSVAFGGLEAVKDVSLSASSGSVTAVIGPNGAGKSTLLNMASGFLEPDSGVVRLYGEDVTSVLPWHRVERGMARTFQDLEIFEGLTVGENVALGLRSPIGNSLLGPLLRWGAYATERRAMLRDTRHYVEQVGLSDRIDEPASSLSYGDQKLLITARLLATGCDLLLFDEPGAGLPRGAIDSVGKIFRGLAADGKAILLVDHNMRLVFGYADYVYVLHHGELIVHGPPESVRANEDVLRVYLSGGGAEEGET